MLTKEQLERAGDNIAEHLGDLIAILEKLLRAGFRTGPTAPLIAAWCGENPEKVVRAIGQLAFVLAVKRIEASQGVRN